MDSQWIVCATTFNSTVSLRWPKETFSIHEQRFLFFFCVKPRRPRFAKEWGFVGVLIIMIILYVCVYVYLCVY